MPRPLAAIVCLVFTVSGLALVGLAALFLFDDLSGPAPHLTFLTLGLMVPTFGFGMVIIAAGVLLLVCSELALDAKQVLLFLHASEAGRITRADAAQRALDHIAVNSPRPSREN